MEPYGFSEYQDWGDAQGGAHGWIQKDPLIAPEAVDWLNKRAPEVAAAKPWFMSRELRQSARCHVLRHR